MGKFGEGFRLGEDDEWGTDSKERSRAASNSSKKSGM
jgi:hypothetical protein